MPELQAEAIENFEAPFYSYIIYAMEMAVWCFDELFRRLRLSLRPQGKRHNHDYKNGVRIGEASHPGPANGATSGINDLAGGAFLSQLGGSGQTSLIDKIVERLMQMILPRMMEELENILVAAVACRSSYLRALQEI